MSAADFARMILQRWRTVVTVGIAVALAVGSAAVVLAHRGATETVVARVSAVGSIRELEHYAIDGQSVAVESLKVAVAALAEDTVELRVRRELGIERAFEEYSAEVKLTILDGGAAASIRVSGENSFPTEAVAAWYVEQLKVRAESFASGRLTDGGAVHLDVAAQPVALPPTDVAFGPIGIVALIAAVFVGLLAGVARGLSDPRIRFDDDVRRIIPGAVVLDDARGGVSALAVLAEAVPDSGSSTVLVRALEGSGDPGLAASLAGDRAPLVVGSASDAAEIVHRMDAQAESSDAMVVVDASSEVAELALIAIVQRADVVVVKVGRGRSHRRSLARFASVLGLVDGGPIPVVVLA